MPCHVVSSVLIWMRNKLQEGKRGERRHATPTASFAIILLQLQLLRAAAVS